MFMWRSGVEQSELLLCPGHGWRDPKCVSRSGRPFSCDRPRSSSRNRLKGPPHRRSSRSMRPATRTWYPPEYRRLCIYRRQCLSPHSQQTRRLLPHRPSVQQPANRVERQGSTLDVDRRRCALESELISELCKQLYVILCSHKSVRQSHRHPHRLVSPLGDQL